MNAGRFNEALNLLNEAEQRFERMRAWVADQITKEDGQ